MRRPYLVRLLSFVRPLSIGYVERLKTGALRAKAWDDAGEVRAVELQDHPFFVATLFQPERAALEGTVPPVVGGFVEGVGSVM